MSDFATTIRSNNCTPNSNLKARERREKEEEEMEESEKEKKTKLQSAIQMTKTHARTHERDQSTEQLVSNHRKLPKT